MQRFYTVVETGSMPSGAMLMTDMLWITQQFRLEFFQHAKCKGTGKQKTGARLLHLKLICVSRSFSLNVWHSETKPRAGLRTFEYTSGRRKHRDETIEGIPIQISVRGKWHIQVLPCKLEGKYFNYFLSSLFLPLRILLCVFALSILSGRFWFRPF